MLPCHVTVTLALALFWACDSAPVERVEIVAHYVPACAPAFGSTPRQLELIALGDFERSNDSVSILASDAASQNVELPQGTRAAELNTLGDSGYWGTGMLDAHNQLSVLLWPKNQSCPLARSDTLEPLSARADFGLGGSARLAALLLLDARGAGVADPDVVGPDFDRPTLFVDLSDASVTRLAPDRDLRERRAHASVSELGERLIVAGGSDPDTGQARQDGEIFDPVLGRFDPQPVLLGVPRARHAALNVPFGGSLLIGGESETGQPLGSVEILSTNAPRFSRVLELLATPRIEPRALLLGEDRILVGGGFVWSGEPQGSAERGYREPVASVEFLSLDLAGVPLEPIRLEPAALDRAFVALGAGGALAAGGCEPGGAADCVPCEQGQGCVSRAVWWIDTEGAPHALEPLPSALSTAAPKLVPGAGGAPWLLAGDRLGRFDPWLARFDVQDAPAGERVSVVGEPLALGPGLFAWLRADATGVEAVGFYHSQRSSFTEDVAPLLVGSAQGVVPHRPPAAPGAADVTLQYSAARGLELSGALAVVSVADTDYAAFTLELSLTSGPPPLLELSGIGVPADARASFGGLQCPWPDFELPDGSNPATLVRLRVQRTADLVRLELSSSNGTGASRPPPCQRSLPERVGIRLVGTAGGISQLTRIEIRRSTE